MDDPSFDDDYFTLDEHEDLDYYLEHAPYLQKNALEQDPQGLMLDEEKGLTDTFFKQEKNLQIQTLETEYKEMQK